MMISPTQQMFWDWRAAVNFVAGGSGSGLILIAALATVAGINNLAVALGGAALVALGLTMVWLEIGRPWRFLNVLNNPRTSWMSREAWVAVLLLPLCAGAFLSGSAALAPVLAVLAAGFLYCQGRLLCASRCIPTWRRCETIWLIVATGLAEGMAIYIILSAGGMTGTTDSTLLLSAIAILLSCVRLITWWTYRNALQNHAPAAGLKLMHRFEPAFVLAGHLAPALLFAATWLLPMASGFLAVVAGILILLSGWALKYGLVTRAAHTQGFALLHTPARGGGSAGPGIKPGWN